MENKRLAEAATRLRGNNIVEDDLIPAIGLDVRLEKTGREMVERVYDVATKQILQEMVVPRKMLMEVSV
jgi:hypothetical protein